MYHSAYGKKDDTKKINEVIPKYNNLKFIRSSMLCIAKLVQLNASILDVIRARNNTVTMPSS